MILYEMIGMIDPAEITKFGGEIREGIREGKVLLEMNHFHMILMDPQFIAKVATDEITMHNTLLNHLGGQAFELVWVERPPKTSYRNAIL